MDLFFQAMPTVDIFLTLFLYGVLGISFFGMFFWRKSRFFSRFLGVIFVCVLWGTFFETKRLVVRNVPITIERLPSLRIGVIADFHLRPSKKSDWIKKTVALMNEQEVDFVVILGDFLSGKSQEFSGFVSPIQNIKVPVYHVLGNHDYFFDRKHRSPEAMNFLRKNLRMSESLELKNEAVFLEKHSVWLVGVEDNYAGFHDLSKAFQNVPNNMPSILLAHSPDIVDELSQEKNPDLVLSGHTHCGQIRFPFLGAVPFTIPTKNGKNLEKHWYPNQRIFITCGVGESGMPARFLNPPEIVVLDIN